MPEGIPDHIAIIMDGNGRWARERGLNRIKGHEKGIISVEAAIEGCIKNAVPYLSLFAFSIENWSRPKMEVDALMGYLSKYLDDKRKMFSEKDIRLFVSGRLPMLPEKIQKKISDICAETEDNKTLNLNLAISYGGKAEIIDAVKSIHKECLRGDRKVDDIDEDCFRRHLYIPEIPDVDLLIRTSGEVRISNFFLWQCAYSEFVFMQKYWPDFVSDDISEAIEVYKKRNRRFGGV